MQPHPERVRRLEEDVQLEARQPVSEQVGDYEDLVVDATTQRVQFCAGLELSAAELRTGPEVEHGLSSAVAGATNFAGDEPVIPRAAIRISNALWNESDEQSEDQSQGVSL